MLGGVELPGEVLAVIGAESRMAPHHHSPAGGEAEVLGEEERGIGIVIVTTISGGYHHLEGIVILRLPDAEVVVAEEVGNGRETQDLAAHPVEILGMIESLVGPMDMRGGGGYYLWNIHIR